MGCVYLARNKINGKCYVGKTIHSMTFRSESHRRDAEGGSPWVFHKAIRKYGWDTFEWSILTEDDDDEFLCFMEKKWIKKLGTKVPNGYNVTDGGDGVIGWSRTEKQRESLSQALSRYWESDASDKQREIVKRPHTEEHKRKISESKKGTPLSDEHKEKLRLANIGKVMDEETKRKISNTLKGKVFSEEYRRKLSLANKGKTRPKVKEAALLKYRYKDWESCNL